MANNLLIFVGSSNVGAYINTMANAVDKLGVDRIVLVNVVGLSLDQQVDFADFVNNTLKDAIFDLAENKFSGQQFSVPKDFRVYQKLKDIYSISHAIETVTHQFLNQNLANLKRIYGCEAIIDLSGLPKRVAIDVLTACLAIGMPNIMIFELKHPAKGLASLYHALKEGDYEHIVLPNWSPLLDNIEFFASRQNRTKLITVVIAIAISLLFTVLYQWGRVRLGDGNWFIVLVIVLFGFFGGILPIVDAWGGLRIKMFFGLKGRNKKFTP